MSHNPPPVSIQAILPREEAVKLVFWQAPDDALFSQDDIAIITGHTAGVLTTMRSSGGGPTYRDRTGDTWNHNPSLALLRRLVSLGFAFESSKYESICSLFRKLRSILLNLLNATRPKPDQKRTTSSYACNFNFT